MERWHYLYFADADYGDAMAAPLVAQVEHVAKTNRSVALYRKRREDGGTHYYFAPSASRLARRFFALPCDEPHPQQRGELVVGSAGRMA